MTIPTRVCALTLIGGLALTLGSCGNGGSGAASNMAGGAAAGSTASAALTGAWKATDACALLDTATVAAVLGSPVQSTNLAAVKDEGNGFLLYSQCEYMLDDGRMLVFGAGQYTNGMTLAEQVADMRRQAAMMTDNKPVDLPGLGKAAIWAADMHALYAFFGDGRYVSAGLSQFDFTKTKQDPTDTVKAQEIAILHKAGV